MKFFRFWYFDIPIYKLSVVFLQFVVLICIFASVCCAPSPTNKGLRELPALRHEEVHDEFGQYALRYITAESEYNILKYLHVNNKIEYILKYTKTCTLFSDESISIIHFR